MTRPGGIPCFALAFLALGAAPPDPQTPVFPAGADVVVLDVVVRDRKGRTVRDLRPDEVTVFEDGVRQPVASFRLVAAASDGPDGTTTAPTEPAAGPGDSRHVNLVTVVFDQLGPEGRRIARQAGLSLLKLADRPDLRVSVFQVRESLRLVQQFTADRDALEAAVREATGQVDTQYTRATEQLEQAGREAEAAQQRVESAATVASSGGALSLARLGREAAMARMAVDALRLTETLQREQQGHSSLYAILALAKQQQRLAGRKTILFFSEGLQVPPALVHVLETAISEANRANVSVYAVDARGLADAPRLESTRQALLEAARAGERGMRSRGVGPVTREEVLASDTAEAALRLDAQGALRDLAESTGGALIGESNDVRRGIERAVGDLRGYYELAYEPLRKQYDGRFRRIDVKVGRPGITVQARRGYFAIPPGEGSVNFAYELDLLRALRATPAPEEVPLRTSVFRFGPDGDAVRYTAIVEIPLSAMLFEPDGRPETDRAHFSIMALVRDAAGAVVEKFSEDSPVFLPRARRDALKQGNAVFSRSFRLAPGPYALELAVVDQLGHKRGVARVRLDVARPTTAVSLSDLALVKRTEPVPDRALPSEDPFRVGEDRVVPYVGEPHLKASDALSLFVVAYPRPASARSELLVELVRDHRLVGQSLLELPAADPKGRIPYFAHVPAEGLAPGRYEVRALLSQSGATAQGRTFFTVTP